MKTSQIIIYRVLLQTLALLNWNLNQEIIIFVVTKKSMNLEVTNEDWAIDDDLIFQTSIKLPYDTIQINNCILADKGKVWPQDLHRFHLECSDWKTTKMKSSVYK